MTSAPQINEDWRGFTVTVATNELCLVLTDRFVHIPPPLLPSGYMPGVSIRRGSVNGPGGVQMMFGLGQAPGRLTDCVSCLLRVVEPLFQSGLRNRVTE